MKTAERDRTNFISCVPIWLQIVFCVPINCFLIFNHTEQVALVHTGGRRTRVEQRLQSFPGHALHEKGSQNQKGVVSLVGSQEQRAFLVLLINC